MRSACPGRAARALVHAAVLARGSLPCSSRGRARDSTTRCKYKEIRRNLQRDVEELQNQGVQDMFVFCTRGEMHKYRVPSLLDAYQRQGFRVHHLPFPDGGAPELEQCGQILDALQRSLQADRLASCLLLQLSVTMTANKAIEILRDLRGGGAIQTVKQYNFLHEFREKYAVFLQSQETSMERPVSR
ncbi:hypothetical protein CRUP_031062 [Coryphaenoides rupestris]|nr:hypothetical protein CRUP_031062 [Coryphaenoides rupestris]